MKKLLRFLFPAILLLAACSPPQQCPEKINFKPLYGREKKCDNQLDADKEFLNLCDKNYKTRKEASEAYANMGWDCFYKGLNDTAMFRFNQAWLLDSSNAAVYWGLGNVLGMQQSFTESLAFFDRSLAIDSTNAKVWECASTSYGNLFFQTKDTSKLDKCISYMKRSVQIDPQNPRAYGHLATAYSSYSQKDSAKKYNALAHQLDHPEAAHQEHNHEHDHDHDGHH